MTDKLVRFMISDFGGAVQAGSLGALLYRGLYQKDPLPVEVAGEKYNISLRNIDDYIVRHTDPNNQLMLFAQEYRPLYCMLGTRAELLNGRLVSAYAQGEDVRLVFCVTNTGKNMELTLQEGYQGLNPAL